ncbi:hypothetical protein D3C86_1422930 [compost metagenome]
MDTSRPENQAVIAKSSIGSTVFKESGKCQIFHFLVVGANQQYLAIRIDFGSKGKGLSAVLETTC